jgi:hypothetical protein
LASIAPLALAIVYDSKESQSTKNRMVQRSLREGPKMEEISSSTPAHTHRHMNLSHLFAQCQGNDWKI